MGKWIYEFAEVFHLKVVVKFFLVQVMTIYEHFTVFYSELYRTPKVDFF